jgi:hypothetical protein
MRNLSFLVFVPNFLASLGMTSQAPFSAADLALYVGRVSSRR